MNYQIYQPHQDLRELVKCYWTLDSTEEVTTDKQTIVPDGCIEMIFHYGDLYKQYDQNGKSKIQPKSFVIGQLTQPLVIEPTGKTGIFAIRFHPNGYEPFATIPIKEMENKAVSMQTLFGTAGTEIEEKIIGDMNTPKRIELIETFLFGQLTEAQTIDRIIKSTVEIILTANGQLTVNELSKQTKINRRQLERKFSTAIGLSPKQLSKTIRLQVALKTLLSKEFSSFTDLAYQGEYYDQAHFNKDFKELTGFTPKTFYSHQLKMSSLFIDD